MKATQNRIILRYQGGEETHNDRRGTAIDSPVTVKDLLIAWKITA